MILDPESFSVVKNADPVEVVWPEFRYQFRKAFDFDSLMQVIATPNFNAAQEWPCISKVLADLEVQYPILRKLHDIDIID